MWPSQKKPQITVEDSLFFNILIIQKKPSSCYSVFFIEAFFVILKKVILISLYFVMKKHLFFKILLFTIPLSAFVFMSNSGGKTGAYSGSPGDGNNCTACHAGSSVSESNITITTNIPTTGYAFNTQYDVTITNSAGGSRNGFQVTAEKDSDNSNVGTFSTVSGSNDTKTVNGNSHITHTSSGNGKSSWSFKWTSPSSEEGKITFYGASVSGNGNGGSSGDKVYTGSSISNSSLSLSRDKRLDFGMFPNPASENVIIQLPSGSKNGSVEFYDYIGRLALTQKVSQTNNSINVQDLSSGVYILKVLADGKIGTQKFIKK